MEKRTFYIVDSSKREVFPIATDTYNDIEIWKHNGTGYDYHYNRFNGAWGTRNRMAFDTLAEAEEQVKGSFVSAVKYHEENVRYYKSMLETSIKSLERTLTEQKQYNEKTKNLRTTS